MGNIASKGLQRKLCIKGVETRLKNAYDLTPFLRHIFWQEKWKTRQSASLDLEELLKLGL